MEKEIAKERQTPEMSVEYRLGLINVERTSCDKIKKKVINYHKKLRKFGRSPETMGGFSFVISVPGFNRDSNGMDGDIILVIHHLL
jgi:hypothetical protein